MLFRRGLAVIGVIGSLFLTPVPAQAVEPPPDVAFLHAAHQANVAEISAGRLAWNKTANPAVKRVAAALMVDHIKMDFEVYQTARPLYVRLPEGTNEEQRALHRRYELAPRDTFDEYFVSTQLAGHRQTLRMLQEQIEEGAEPSVRAVAQKAIPVIERHGALLREAAQALGIAGYVGKGGRPTP
ncbi:DUF4142 domain-containing protein [Actinoplanes philippinensis]|uniref:DUF4142 domain-containing protein n=1 Tax=Actinoplanes philippinensis TaxID=35752 RepID=UPI0033E8406E